MSLRRAAVSTAAALVMATAVSAIAGAQPAGRTVDARLVPIVYDGEDGSWRTEYWAVDAAGQPWSLARFVTDPVLGRLRAGAPLRVDVPGPDPRPIPRSTPGAATGWRRAAPVVDGRGGAAFSTSFADAPLLGAYPVLVVPCAFSDAPPLSDAPRSLFETTMGDAFPGVGAFVRAASNGRASLDGTVVTDWVQLDRPAGDFYVGNSTDAPDGYSSGFRRDQALATACVAAARTADASLDPRAFRAIQVQHAKSISASYAYLAPISIPGVDSTQRFGLAVNASWSVRRAGTQAHEIGHTLGLRHAGGPYGNAYDSRWDVMSSSSHTTDAASGLRHGTFFHGFHRLRLGWIPDEEVRTLADGETDTLDLLAPRAAAAGTRIVRVPLPGASPPRTLTIATRQRDGDFENALPGEGIVLHDAVSTTSNVRDRDGNGNPNDAGAVLGVGEELLDSLTGLTVRVLAQLAGGYRVALERNVPFLLTAEPEVRFQVGRPSAFGYRVEGGRGSVRVEAASTLPTGLTLDTTTRTVVGTPRGAGRTTVRLRAIDGDDRTADADVEITMDALDPAKPPFRRERAVGVAGTDTLVRLLLGETVRGASDVQVASPLPPGATLRTVETSARRDWILDWTPTVDTSVTLTVTLGAISPIPRTWAVTLDVPPAPLRIAGDAERPPALEARPVADTLRREGGPSRAPSSWRLIDGTLPAGWTLDAPTGVIAGTTTDTGRFVATAELAAGGDTARRALAWTVEPGLGAIVATWPDTLAQRAPRDDTLRVTSRLGPVTWRIAAGALPAGITLESASGRLVGTPTTAEAFAATVVAAAGGAERRLELTGVVVERPLAIAWAGAQSAFVQGELVADTLLLSSGNGTPVTLAAEALPAGVTFDPASRVLRGRPREVGEWTVRVRATQSGQTQTLERTWRVASMVALDVDSLVFVVGREPATVLTATAAGDVRAITFALSTGALPPGIALRPDGTFPGSPVALGADSALLRITVARADGSYTASGWLRWRTVEPVIAEAEVTAALFGGAAADGEAARALDLLGNANGRVDIGDVLRWLVRRGLLPGGASVADVMPALLSRSGADR